MKIRATILSVLVLLLAGSAWAGDVTQGRFVQLGASPTVLVLEEYDTNFSKEYPYGTPTGIMSEFDVAHAKIGITPEPGDILRIVYTDQGGHMAALKVMNVSKQDLRKK
jgi:hypothetical protein